MITMRLLCCLAALSFCVGSVVAQDTVPRPSPSPEPLIPEVQAQGYKDGKEGRPAKSIADLDTLHRLRIERELLTINSISSAYEKAYDEGKAARPWFERFRPEYGWIVAGIFAVIVIGKEFLRGKIAAGYAWLWEGIYQRLAGTSLFWRIALGRYRAALIRNNQTVTIPFRLGRPLEMDKVFVRLQVSGKEGEATINAQTAIEETKACIVLGPPGSGKSMLLRKLALDITRGHGSRQSRVPVIVELSRFNEGGGNLEDRIVAAFGQNGFPNAQHFVEAGLRRGFLFLLFDGLDEVGAKRSKDASSAREQVAGQVRDLIRLYPKCRFLVTCRTAVYHSEFDDCTDHRFAILEFDDEQIQVFTDAWATEMPRDKSPEQLFRSLSERPHILAVARNPLMLTIIAFLYTDKAFVLPHSRVEFFDKAVKELLDHWKEERNDYTEPQKAIVLRHLALWNQDTTGPATADRRTMGLKDVLREIQAILLTLTLKPEDAQPLLDEITERSGLLLAVDGGERYQFSHLTLQEFLAAKELSADPEGLLRRFAKAPDDWRETVKLWCGLPHDSTQLIEALRRSDDVLAFECVADAEQVDERTWRSLLEEMSPHLGESGPRGGAVVRGFGLVAADPRARGRTAFGHLEDILKDGSSPRKEAAYQAMSLTNLPEAAQRLAALAQFDDVPRGYLPLMGDVAVPVLESIAVAGDVYSLPDDAPVWAIDSLHRVGTVAAAKALVRLLFKAPVSLILVASAWAVSSLIRKPVIEKVLANLAVPADANVNDFLWIWEPFAPVASPVTRIMATVANLIFHDSQGATVPEARIDTRLAIPLLLISADLPSDNFSWATDNHTSMELTEDEIKAKLQVAKNERLISLGAKHGEAVRRILSSLSEKTCIALLTVRSLCSRDQWQNLATSSVDTFRENLQLGIAKSLYLGMLLTAIGADLVLWGGSSSSPSRPWLALAGVALLLFSIGLPRRALPLGTADPSFDSLVLSSFLLAIGAALSATTLLLLDTNNGQMMFAEIRGGPQRLSNILVAVAVSIPWLLPVWVYERRWYRRRAVSGASVGICVACCLGPVIVAVGACYVLLSISSGVTSVNANLLLATSIVAVFVTWYVLAHVPYSGYLFGWNWRWTLVCLRMWGSYVGLLCCGAYSVVCFCVWFGLARGLVVTSAILCAIGFCLASAYYRMRMEANPFRSLLREIDGFEGMLSSAPDRPSAEDSI